MTYTVYRLKYTVARLPGRRRSSDGSDKAVHRKADTVGETVGAADEHPEPVKATWPLIGRAAELERITALICEGRRSIVLAGPVGVGKTRLATECVAAAASQGFVPLRVAATQAAARLPFGAFASLLPELDPATELLEVLRQIVHEVVERGGGSPVALFVDDAHLLDDFSATLTHLLATMDTVCVVTTLRSGALASDSIVALWKDGLAERLEVRALTTDEVGELLAAALGGPVEGATAHLLHKRTEGNVLFLRELVVGAVESDVLRRTEGVWRIGGVLPASARLVEIVEARLGELDDPIRRMLGVLALGEPLEAKLLQTVEADLDLEALEHKVLLRFEPDGRRLYARLPHPIYGDVVRTRLSPLRARASAHALADGLEATGARRREDNLRLATWRLEGGGSLHPDILVAAATTARRRHAFPLAERLAQAAVDAGAGFEAGLLLGQVCWLQGRAAEAEDHLRAIMADATTDSQRALLASERIIVLDVGLKRTDLALQVAKEAESTITDLACRDQITADRARILGRSGNYQAAAALAEPLLRRASGRSLVSACFAAATSMTFTGQTAGAIEATERGLDAHLQLTGPPLPFGPHLHLMMRGAALLIAGHLAEARALAQREYDKAIEEDSAEARPWFSGILAWIALKEGRVTTAARLAGESAGGFAELRWPLFVRCALMLRAHALALLGETDSARAALAQLDALNVPASELFGPEILRARAWTEVAGRNLAEGRRRLSEAADMAQQGGAWALESAALHDLARLGRAPEVVPRLRKLAESVEGVLAPAHAAHAAALTRGDALSLEEASFSFEDCGALLLAAEAAADAAVAWRRKEEPRKATAAERRSSALVIRCEGARTPSLITAAPARAVLRPRELEIARLAAAGLSNKEIAARLFLSHRTVENQLHAAYEKLGVQKRAELSEALES